MRLIDEFVGRVEEREDGRRRRMGTRDCVFPGTKRELKAKRGGVLGREERGAAFCIPFLFPFSFFFSPFFFFFPFFRFSLFYETKRNETKLYESYSAFMNDLGCRSIKIHQIVIPCFYIRLQPNSTNSCTLRAHISGVCPYQRVYALTKDHLQNL